MRGVRPWLAAAVLAASIPPTGASFGWDCTVERHFRTCIGGIDGGRFARAGAVIIAGGSVGDLRVALEDNAARASMCNISNWRLQHCWEACDVEVRTLWTNARGGSMALQSCVSLMQPLGAELLDSQIEREVVAEVRLNATCDGPAEGGGSVAGGVYAGRAVLMQPAMWGGGCTTAQHVLVAAAEGAAIVLVVHPSTENALLAHDAYDMAALRETLGTLPIDVATMSQHHGAAVVDHLAHGVRATLLARQCEAHVAPPTQSTPPPVGFCPAAILAGLCDLRAEAAPPALSGTPGPPPVCSTCAVELVLPSGRLMCLWGNLLRPQRVESYLWMPGMTAPAALGEALDVVYVPSPAGHGCDVRDYAGLAGEVVAVMQDDACLPYTALRRATAAGARAFVLLPRGSARTRSAYDSIDAAHAGGVQGFADLQLIPCHALTLTAGGDLTEGDTLEAEGARVIIGGRTVFRVRTTARPSTVRLPAKWAGTLISDAPSLDDTGPDVVPPAGDQVLVMWTATVGCVSALVLCLALCLRRVSRGEGGVSLVTTRRSAQVAQQWKMWSLVQRQVSNMCATSAQQQLIPPTDAPPVHPSAAAPPSAAPYRVPLTGLVGLVAVLAFAGIGCAAVVLGSRAAGLYSVANFVAVQTVFVASEDMLAGARSDAVHHQLTTAALSVGASLAAVLDDAVAVVDELHDLAAQSLAGGEATGVAWDTFATVLPALNRIAEVHPQFLPSLLTVNGLWATAHAHTAPGGDDGWTRAVVADGRQVLPENPGRRHPGRALAGSLAPEGRGPLDFVRTVERGARRVVLARFATPDPALAGHVHDHPLTLYAPVTHHFRLVACGAVSYPLTAVRAMVDDAVRTMQVPGLKLLVYAPGDRAVVATSWGEDTLYSIQPPGGRPYTRLHTLETHPEPAVNGFGAYLSRGGNMTVNGRGGFEGKFSVSVNDSIAPRNVIVVSYVTRGRGERARFMQRSKAYVWRTKLFQGRCLLTVTDPCLQLPADHEDHAGVFFTRLTAWHIYRNLTADYPEVEAAREPVFDDVRALDELSDCALTGTCLRTPPWTSTSYSMHMTIRPVLTIPRDNPAEVVLVSDAHGAEANLMILGNGQLLLRHLSYGCTTVPLAEGMPGNVWTDLTAVVDYIAGSCAMYVNGSVHSVATISQSYRHLPSGPLVIGVRFAGYWRCLVIFNVSLTPEDVAAYTRQVNIANGRTSWASRGGVDHWDYAQRAPNDTYHVHVLPVQTSTRVSDVGWAVAALLPDGGSVARADANTVRAEADAYASASTRGAALLMLLIGVVVLCGLVALLQPVIGSINHCTDTLDAAAHMNTHALANRVQHAPAVVYAEQRRVHRVADDFANRVLEFAPYVAASTSLVVSASAPPRAKMPGAPPHHAAIVVVRFDRGLEDKKEKGASLFTTRQEIVCCCAAAQRGQMFIPDLSTLLEGVPDFDNDFQRLMWFSFSSCSAACTFGLNAQAVAQRLVVGEGPNAAQEFPLRIGIDWGQVSVSHRADVPSFNHHDGAPVVLARQICLDVGRHGHVCVSQAVMDELWDSDFLTAPPPQRPISDGESSRSRRYSGLHASSSGTGTHMGDDERRSPLQMCDIMAAGALRYPAPKGSDLPGAPTDVVLYYLKPGVRPDEGNLLMSVCLTNADINKPVQNPAHAQHVGPGAGVVHSSIRSFGEVVAAAQQRTAAATLKTSPSSRELLRRVRCATLARVDMMLHASFSLHNYNLFEGDSFVSEAFGYVVACADREQGTVLCVVGGATIIGWNVVERNVSHMEAAVRYAQLLAASLDGRQEYQDFFTIGICTGDVTYGAVGDANRRFFRPFGATVELCSLLSTAAGQMGVMCMYAPLPSASFQLLDDSSLVNAVRPVDVWCTENHALPEITIYQVRTETLDKVEPYAWSLRYHDTFHASDYALIESHTEDPVLLMVVILRGRGEQLIEPNFFEDFLIGNGIGAYDQRRKVPRPLNAVGEGGLHRIDTFTSPVRMPLGYPSETLFDAARIVDDKESLSESTTGRPSSAAKCMRQRSSDLLPPVTPATEQMTLARASSQLSRGSRLTHEG